MVQLKRLSIRALRCVSDAAFDLGPGLNVFTGDNGAGKTSILEAAFLLSHGRSFRPGSRDALSQLGSNGLQVFAEVLATRSSGSRLGLGRECGRWRARLDGEDASLGELVLRCPVVCFSPGSHSLVSGPSEDRRRYLDWGLFHVEHEFVGQWRRYQRALKQRNALLRSEHRYRAELYSAWELELAVTGEAIDQLRRRYIEALRQPLQQVSAILLPELGAVDLVYQRGWPEPLDLNEQFQAARDRDIVRGHTRHGAHRADISVQFEAAAGKEYFSRGQEKLVALSLYLAQCLHFHAQKAEWPVFCLDDLASELDQRHQQALWSMLAHQGQQILVTGTHHPAGFDLGQARLFHVEQGVVSTLL